MCECKRCKKLETALFTLMGESDLENLKVMEGYLSGLTASGTEEALSALSAMRILIEVLEEDLKNENADGICQ